MAQAKKQNPEDTKGLSRVVRAVQIAWKRKVALALKATEDWGFVAENSQTPRLKIYARTVAVVQFDRLMLTGSIDRKI